MDPRIHRFENPARVAELNPEATLGRLGLRAGQVVCDIGAGSGVFTLPAARMTRGRVYAIDIRRDMLDLIAGKAAAEGLDQVVLLEPRGDRYDLSDGEVDLVLMVTVLHEIDRAADVLAEVRRILATGGQVAVIEFHPWRTPMGPPPEQRMDGERIRSLLADAGFTRLDVFDLGENFACQVFGAAGDR